MPELLSVDISEESVDRKRILAMHKTQAEPEPGEDVDKPDGIENLCPFGCLNEELNDIGHCKHLIGFTSNGKTYEPQIKRMRPAREADGRIVRDDAGKMTMEWDGSWITDGRKEVIQLVKSTDELRSGGSYGRPCVSSRVYRPDADVFSK